MILTCRLEKLTAHVVKQQCDLHTPRLHNVVLCVTFVATVLTKLQTATIRTWKVQKLSVLLTRKFLKVAVKCWYNCTTSNNDIAFVRHTSKAG